MDRRKVGGARALGVGLRLGVGAGAGEEDGQVARVHA